MAASCGEHLVVGQTLAAGGAVIGVGVVVGNVVVVVGVVVGTVVGEWECCEIDRR